MTLHCPGPRPALALAPVAGLMLALAAAIPARSQDSPALLCRFDRACTSATDCIPADVTVRLTDAHDGTATLNVKGIGDRPAVFAYGGGMLSVTSKPAEGQGLWSLSVPDWPGSEDAAFAEIWAVEGRISAWAGTCAVAEPAE